MARVIKKWHGKDRARFQAVNRVLVSLKNRNAKVGGEQILTAPQLVCVNTVITQMNTLLAETVTV